MLQTIWQSWPGALRLPLPEGDHWPEEGEEQELHEHQGQAGGRGGGRAVHQAPPADGLYQQLKEKARSKKTLEE